MEELASAKRSHNAHKGIFGQRIKTFDGGAAYLRNRRYIKASTATARRNVVGASIAAVNKGKKREGVRFKLMVRFEKPGSKD